MPERSITFRFLAAPTDVAAAGASAIGGGKVLEWIDNTAYACAAGWSGRSCVTAFVGNVNFLRPVNAGDLVEITAKLVRTGRTSMHITVTVRTMEPRTRTSALTTSCTVIFVALDDTGRPTEVPTWEPTCAEELQAAQAAVEEGEIRNRVEDAMRGLFYPEHSSGQQTTLRFLAAPSDANLRGTTHGGVVMRWIDEAAHLCATTWTGRRGAAAYLGGIRFYRPIRIGHLVEVRARLIYTGPRSMHITIRVSSGDPINPTMQVTTHCLAVFVALDSTARPLPVRPFEPTTSGDRSLEHHAKELIALRSSLNPSYPA